MTNIGQSIRYSFLMGTISGWFHIGLTVFVGLWLAPFLLRYMDREEYGLFSLANEMLMWFGLADIGISGALQTRVAHLSGKPDRNRLNELASTAFYAQLAEAVFVLVAGLAVTSVYTSFFNIRTDLKRDATLLLALLVIRSTISTATRVFSSLLIAHQRIHVDNIIKIGVIVLRTALIVILVRRGFGVVSLGIGSIVTAIAVTLPTVAYTYRLLPGLSLRWRHVSWKAFTPLLSMGMWFFLKYMARMGVVGSSKMITAKLVSLSAVTSLALTGRLYLLAQQLLMKLQMVLMPILGNMIGKGVKERAFMLFSRYFIVGNALSCTILGGLFAMNEGFVAGWVGRSNYAGEAVDFLLCLQGFLLFWSSTAMAILTANLQLRRQTLCRLAEGTFGVILSISMGYLLGLEGIVAGLVVGTVATSFWYLPLTVCRAFDIKPVEFLKRLALPSLLIGIVVWGIALFIRNIPFPGPWYISALVRCVIVVTLGLSLIWSAVLKKRERTEILKLADFRGRLQARKI